MKRTIITLLALGSLSAYADCTFTKEVREKEHQSFLGFISYEGDYLPSRKVITTLSLKRNGDELQNEILRLKSIDNLITPRQTQKWKNECLDAKKSLIDKATIELCGEEVIRKISNLDCSLF